MNSTVEIYEGLAQLLNSEILRQGQIQPSNPRIWTALHAIDDRLWRAMLEEYCEDPVYAQVWPTAQALLEHLGNYESQYAPWTITPYPGLVRSQARPRSHQCTSTVWRWLMQTREVYCAAHGLNLPNSDSSKSKGEFQ